MEIFWFEWIIGGVMFRLGLESLHVFSPPGRHNKCCPPLAVLENNLVPPILHHLEGPQNASLGLNVGKPVGHFTFVNNLILQINYWVFLFLLIFFLFVQKEYFFLSILFNKLRISLGYFTHMQLLGLLLLFYED